MQTSRLALLCAFAGLLLLQGCASMTAYHPRTGPDQNLRFAQGVGTLSERNVENELVMYPTFKMQDAGQPTFTIGYANNSATSQEFSTENIRAFYRGVPVPIYTYTEKVDEIRQEKLGKQIALAVLGIAGTVAATNAASHQTYTSNTSGVVGNRYGSTFFRSSNTVRVYDPGAGLIAGAAVGGATGLGLSQIEYNAQNQELVAGAILQRNTVDPQRMVSGQLILKGCCDRAAGTDDTIRFEVSINNKVSVFEFLRLPSAVSPPPQLARTASAAQPTYVAPAPQYITQPTLEVVTSAPAGTSQPTTTALTVSAPRSFPTPQPTPIGQWSIVIENLPEVRQCNPQPLARFTAKSGPIESYTVACSSGDILAVKCDYGDCRVLK